MTTSLSAFPAANENLPDTCIRLREIAPVAAAEFINTTTNHDANAKTHSAGRDQPCTEATQQAARLDAWGWSGIPSPAISTTARVTARLERLDLARESIPWLPGASG
jgi:hypothetical protein